MNYRTWAMLVVTLASLTPLSARAAFKCPATDVKSGEKLTLSADDVAEKAGALGSGVKATIQRMRAEGATSGTIVDRLVVADCSRIDAESNLPDGDKARQVRRFASKVADFIYTPSGMGEEDIVVDVPVPTTVYTQLEQAAKKAGMSEDAWVNRAIEARLAAP